MARDSLAKFQRRLALNGYYRERFGVADPLSQEAVRAWYRGLRGVKEGRDAAGRSHLVQHLEAQQNTTLSPDELLKYDANVEHHMERVNQGRDDPIRLKYFQLLAALMTEDYLSDLADDRDQLHQRLNDFVARINDRRSDRLSYPTFDQEDLNKIAYWMATGSGKTLLMHLNYHQYRRYFPEAFDNILLVTPNEGLSRQHLAELRSSGIPCGHFSASSDDLFDQPSTVKVIEITKLKDEASGEGESVEVGAFEGRNLVFVDEGHKGAGSDAQTWRRRRERIASDGFTFEYSATFGQAVAGSTSVEVAEEYGKSILIDYSYPRFYEDGYGKNYRILNLQQEIPTELTRDYLLGNLLGFYQQVKAFRDNATMFYQEFNVHPPLLVFIGHTVTAGKTQSQLSQNDKASLSDVEELLVFLDWTLRNPDREVVESIERILAGEVGLQTESGDELFQDLLVPLRATKLDAEELYDDLRRKLLHTRTSGRIELVEVEKAAGEIGLRAGDADRLFGLINIGDSATFLKRIRENQPSIPVVTEHIRESLFQEINTPGSDVQMLLGARKFIEGWDSWRVSAMGLLNIGRGEGPQIIQLFGRGVRLLGKDRSLKRSSELEDVENPPDTLPLVETLQVFGVRADYMEKFREYLEEEGIDTETSTTVTVPVRQDTDFTGRGLLTVEPVSPSEFETSVRLRLESTDAVTARLDLSPQAERLVSPEMVRERPRYPYEAERHRLPSSLLGLLDWQAIYRDLWSFKEERGYSNLIFTSEDLRQIVQEGRYVLSCPRHMIHVQHFSEIGKIERIVRMLLKQYVEDFYRLERRQWEKGHLQYVPLEEASDENLLDEYVLQVNASRANEFLEALDEKLEDGSLYRNEDGQPERLHIDRHLYDPLLVTPEGDEVKVRPEGVNQAERRFAEDFRSFFDSEKGKAVLEEWEVFLLRNQSRGKGVGFLLGEDHDERFFPDFILWLMGEEQHIAFVDPHGLVHAGRIESYPKAQFASQIKEYEQELNEEAGTDAVHLHSFLISAKAGFEDLSDRFDLDDREEFHDLHVFFHDEVGDLIEAIVGNQ